MASVGKGTGVTRGIQSLWQHSSSQDLLTGTPAAPGHAQPIRVVGKQVSVEVSGSQIGKEICGGRQLPDPAFSVRRPVRAVFTHSGY